GGEKSKRVSTEKSGLLICSVLIINVSTTNLIISSETAVTNICVEVMVNINDGPPSCQNSMLAHRTDSASISIISIEGSDICNHVSWLSG
ncbi:MAG: hypothetical protein IKA34_05665, partial [Bacteroidales bacterium]|nr:hypothetical protein [Bacteroidales bacterium]